MQISIHALDEDGDYLASRAADHVKSVIHHSEIGIEYYQRGRPIPKEGPRRHGLGVLAFGSKLDGKFPKELHPEFHRRYLDHCDEIVVFTHLENEAAVAEFPHMFPFKIRRMASVLIGSAADLLSGLDRITELVRLFLQRMQNDNIQSDGLAFDVPYICNTSQIHRKQTRHIDALRSYLWRRRKAPTAFISYRTHGGTEAARLLWGYLRQAGVDAFLDTENITKGQFAPQIIESIKARDHFLPIISHDALTPRPQGREDWMLTEVNEALRAGKHILPIVTTNGRNDLELTTPLAQIYQPYQAVSLSRDYFGASLSKLVTLIADHTLVSR